MSKKESSNSGFFGRSNSNSDVDKAADKATNEFGEATEKAFNATDGASNFEGSMAETQSEEKFYLNEEVAALNKSQQGLPDPRSKDQIAQEDKSSTIGGPKTPVKLVSPVVYQCDGKEAYLVVTLDAPVSAYLVETSKVENTRAEQLVELEKACSVYDWSKELEFLYPDIETVRQNALRSFWKAGALQPEDLNDSAVRRNLFSSAYPYKLP
jgi:hypothetical protein